MSASFATLNMVILWTVILAALEWMFRCVVNRIFAAIFQGNEDRVGRILLEHRNMFEMYLTFEWEFRPVPTTRQSDLVMIHRDSDIVIRCFRTRLMGVSWLPG